MNILVVGGTGFVGQHLVKELCKKNHNISVICRKRRNNEYIDIGKLPKVKIHYGTDVLNYENLQKYFKNIDVVFNLAGYISFKQADKKKLIAVNRDGTLNILKACSKHNVKKLIHVSSTAALGFSNAVIDESHKFDWSKYKKCVYSFSKHLPDKQLLESELNSIIIYPSLILGPGDKSNTLMLLDAIKKEKIPFNTPGSNSYVDVRDLVKALILLMDKGVRNEGFIVSAENYSLKEMCSIIAKELGAKLPKRTLSKKYLFPLLGAALMLEKINKNPPITYENIFMGFQNRVHSTNKISKLGWKPDYTLSQTVKDSWKWITEVGN
ncbi:NAD-dependent epimerase/dehydratase family protein [Candidatus Woesearchaeota archaeon]|nr:NAD-dependent epimerase/dehydratase family protein [Candidatus Woesearchaeota archaeon]